MDAGLFDVLHDAADHDGPGLVGDRIDVELERVFDELVDQHGMLGRRVDRARHVADRACPCRTRSPFPARRAHTRAARPRGTRSSAPPRALPRARSPCRSPAAGCPDPTAAARSGGDLRRGRSNRATCRESSRLRPAARATASAASVRRTGRDTRRRHRPCLALDHRHDVFEGQRLEIQPVGRVVVGRHRLGIAVDHHRFEARRRAAQTRRDSSSSRTRGPGRCGSVRCRE